MQEGAIFPLFYLPPIEFFSSLIQNQDNVLIEKFEHFPKQTYRNRTAIHSPNGKLDLIIPVTKGSNLHTKIKDVRISYEFKWQRQHLMSLQTSYRNSAYFEFYEDSFVLFYEKKWDFLFDYNEQILQLLLRLLKLKIPYQYCKEYHVSTEYSNDFRESIHPKRTADTVIKPYFQVFEERNGFLPNLSIVDLLFNQGPQSTKFLI